MVDPRSPVQVINQKEAELRSRIEAARRQAEVRLQATSKEAAQMLAQAEQEGQAAAQRFYQQHIEATNQETEAILAQAQAEAMALRQQATARLNRAVERIVDLVLPPDISTI